MTVELQVFDSVRPEIASALAEIVLDRATRERTHGSNNVGGWKSGIDFFDWSYPWDQNPIRELHLELFTRLGAWPIGWAMINRAGSYHKRHAHGLRYTCGVYYVTAGDPPAPTIFELPSLETKLPGLTRVSDLKEGPDGKIERHVTPAPGRLVIFPGSMFHRVPVYEGDAPRVSIAFEVRP